MKQKFQKIPGKKQKVRKRVFWKRIFRKKILLKKKLRLQKRKTQILMKKVRQTLMPEIRRKSFQQRKKTQEMTSAIQITRHLPVKVRNWQ